MPIVNGKYINPGWTNGTRPPINAQNLNDISDSLERIDSQGTGGGSGNRTCRFVIGTSAAGWTAADCDYLCDGTDDDLEIQAAIDALPAAGGEIVILDGTYHISKTIQILNGAIGIRGNGMETTILESGISEAIRIWMYVESRQHTFLLSGLTIKNTDSTLTARVMVGYCNSDISSCRFEDIELYLNLLDNNSGVSSAAIVAQNTFIQTSAPVTGRRYMIDISGSVSSESLKRPCLVIQGNIFYSTSPANTSLINSNMTGDFVFCENLVQCENSNKILLDNCTITGNKLRNCDITCFGKSSISGNSLQNGDIFGGNISQVSKIGGVITISGNQLYHGRISATSSAVVTGNAIQSPTEYGIQIGSSNPAAYEYDTPLVEGNLIIFDSGSTATGIQIANHFNPNSYNFLGCVIMGNKIINSPTPISIALKWQNCVVVNNFFNIGAISNQGSSNTIKNNGPTLS